MKNPIVWELHPWVDCDDFIAQQLGEVSFSHYSAFLASVEESSPTFPTAGVRPAR